MAGFEALQPDTYVGDMDADADTERDDPETWLLLGEMNAKVQWHIHVHFIQCSELINVILNGRAGKLGTLA